GIRDYKVTGVQTCALPISIRFEDATAHSKIAFTHSFGAQKLGSLLESTGSGCVWFDYNNDGFPDLYVSTGKPLEGSIHPYPLKRSEERRVGKECRPRWWRE